MAVEPPVIDNGYRGVEGVPGSEEVEVEKLGIEDTLFQSRERDGPHKDAVREDQDILVVVFSLVVVRAVREVVSFIIFPRFVDEFIGIFR
jgi:hypothetical protein